MCGFSEPEKKKKKEKKHTKEAKKAKPKQEDEGMIKYITADHGYLEKSPFVLIAGYGKNKSKCNSDIKISTLPAPKTNHLHNRTCGILLLSTKTLFPSSLYKVHVHRTMSQWKIDWFPWI